MKKMKKEIKILKNANQFHRKQFNEIRRGINLFTQRIIDVKTNDFEKRVMNKIDEMKKKLMKKMKKMKKRFEENMNRLKILFNKSMNDLKINMKNKLNDNELNKIINELFV